MRLQHHAKTIQVAYMKKIELEEQDDKRNSIEEQ
jgi:hypothetical protein